MYDWSGPSFFTSGRELFDVRRSTIVECIGPITYNDTEIRRDIANFKAALAGKNFAEAFLPVAAPESARGVRFNRYYKDDDAFLAAIGDALKAEYHAIVDAGLLIQLDDALLAHEYDRLLGIQSEAEVHKGFEAYIEMLNYALSGIPEEKVRYHVCWGSWNVPHTSDVPLRTLLSLVLKVKAQGYCIEAANPQHEHEFQVWKDVRLPDGKILLPGVISHATNVVEHPELVSLRICNFAKLVGRENVIAGTDCGFSQNWNTPRVHPQVQWAKLEALAEGARLATKALWPERH
jgi:5-methyltetrahydropteroyltriglutamate--homocysteine methyltransferase